MTASESSLNSTGTRRERSDIDALSTLVQSELAARSPGNGAAAAIAAAEQLAVLARELRAECERLKKSLAEVTEERDLYLQAAYESARAGVPSDIDFDELRRMSAGPVELLS